MGRKVRTNKCVSVNYFSGLRKSAHARIRRKARHENRLASYLDQIRLRHLLKIVLSHTKAMSESTILDVGCREGPFSSSLASLAQVGDIVGVDVEKWCLKRQKRNEKVSLVNSDANYLPFAVETFHIIICTSMLEHMLNLDGTLSKLKAILQKNGILFVGYPLETTVFKNIWRAVSPREFKFIDQTQTLFVNPYSHKLEDYWKLPSTHKQTYLSIRKGLDKNFRLVRRIKLPFGFLPDSANYYEIAELIIDSDKQLNEQLVK